MFFDVRRARVFFDARESNESNLAREGATRRTQIATRANAERRRNARRREGANARRRERERRTRDATASDDADAVGHQAQARAAERPGEGGGDTPHGTVDTDESVLGERGDMGLRDERAGEVVRGDGTAGEDVEVDRAQAVDRDGGGRHVPEGV